MRLIDGYLGRAVIMGTLIALSILVAIAAAIDLLGELQELGGEYTWLQAVAYTLYGTPQRIYEFSPSALLLGALLGLGDLAAHSELMVLRAAGVSVLQVALSVLKAGAAVMLIAVILGEWVAPAGEARAYQVQRSAQSEVVSLKARHGVWAKDGRRFIHVQDIFPDLRLAHIRVYEFDDALRLTRASFAARAEFTDGQWQLYEVRHHFIEAQGIKTTAYAQEQWARLLAPEWFDVLVIKPEEMAVGALAKYIDYLKQNELDAARYELALWTRFTIPVSGLVMLLLALPFVFGSTRAGSAGQRLFIGALLGVSIYLLNRILNHAALVVGLPPILGAVLPVLPFLAASIMMLRRVR